MKKFLILFLVILFQISCKSGNDIFATFRGGTITRSEFNDWLESRKAPIDLIYKDKYAMGDYLRQIAVEKLTAEKAESSGFNNERFYILIENTLSKNLLTTFLTAEITEKVSFTEKAADLSIIRLFIKNDNKALLNRKENKKRIINELLLKLKEGEDFNVLAKKYSEDALSVKNGHLGVLPECIMEHEIVKAISHLKENDYTTEPVLIDRSLCLIKLHKRYILTEKNIKDFVSDKKNVEKIIDFYKSRTLDELLTKILTEDKTIKSDNNSATFRKKGEVIFSIRGEVFTSDELNEILNLFYLLRYGMLPVDEFSFKEKKITSEKIFKERILALEANRRGIDSGSKYKRHWFYLKRAALAGLYKYNFFLKNISLTDKDVRHEYELNRNKKYYKIKKTNNNEKKIYLSFQEVKSKIKNQLVKEKLKSFKKKWDEDILAGGKFTIENKDFS